MDATLLVFASPVPADERGSATHPWRPCSLNAVDPAEFDPLRSFTPASTARPHDAT